MMDGRSVFAQRSIRSVAQPVLGCAALLALLALDACKQQNQYVPPPPPKVTVAPPVQKTVTSFIEATGNASAVNSVDLMARVQGFLEAISYVDGTEVKKGDILFTIQPLPYYVLLQQAQAQVAGAQATLKLDQIQTTRQTTLREQNVNSQQDLDTAVANQDVAAANLASAQASQQTAAINYSYTRVAAPFDGVVSNHLQSVGSLVGTTPTQLATIVQLDPIWVYFTLGEQDVQRIRVMMREKGMSAADLTKVAIEVGLQTETGYPHAGHLDYASRTVDASTGTLQVRGVLDNPGHVLLPGNFVRVRVPTARDVPAMLVPDTAIGADQGGRYVLVVDADNVVERRRITTGDVYDGLRVVDSGLKPDEKVIVAGLQRAVVGQKVAPQGAPQAGPQAAAATN